MKKYKLFIGLILAGVLLLGGFNVFGQSSPMIPPNYFDGTYIVPRVSTWKLGSPTSTDAYFRGLTVTSATATTLSAGTLTITGLAVSPLIVGGSASSTITGDGTLSTIGGSLYITSNLGIGTTTPIGLLHIATGTTNALVVSTAGNVGISTTSPSSLFSVAGASLFGGNITATGTLTVSSTSTLAGATFSGNVGIGTTSPVSQLNIYSPTVDNVSFGLTLSAAGVARDRLIFYPTGNYGYITRQGNADSFWNIQKSNGISQMYFRGNGNVGIGTTTPSSLFSVAGASLFGGNITATGTLTISSTSTLAGATFSGNVGIGTTTPLTTTLLQIATGSLTVLKDGNVGIGTTTPLYNLSVQGSIAQTNAKGCTTLNVDANGQFYCQASSLQYKKNIKPLTFNINKFLSMQPINFEYKDNLSFKVKGIKTGFLAEQVDKVFPELVVYKNGKPDEVDISKIPIYTFKIVQKQQATIKNLQERIRVLETKIK